MEDTVSKVLTIFMWGSVAFFIFMFVSSMFAASAEYEQLMGLKEVCEVQGGQFLIGQYGTHVCFPEKMFK